MPAFAFPAEAGTHLPTPEGWKTAVTDRGLFFDAFIVRYKVI